MTPGSFGNKMGGFAERATGQWQHGHVNPKESRL